MNSFLKSISFFSIIALALVFCSNGNPFQNDKLSELLSKTNLFNQRFPQEKVYLHLDRPSYWTNDTIWFKAYLKNSPVVDCNLHVELVNATGTVISRKLYWVQNGLAYGDIDLCDTLSTGVYQIRAYTDWMRNFDDHWYFQKDLMLWNLAKTIPKDEFRQLKKREVDVQFLPEGGTFVTGITNRIAFKAIDQNGVGLDVNGIITDDMGNNITAFRSGFKGMGSFLIKPQKGRKYTANITVSADLKVKVDLPDHREDAVAMSIDPVNSDMVKIQITENTGALSGNLSADLFLVAQSNGMVFLNRKIELVNGVSVLNIEKDKLPTGITQFTLFDVNLIPICERLVFVNNHDFVRVEITPDKKVYSKREQVQLEIKALNNKGRPCLTNLSMSVFNADNHLQSDEYPGNILTQFLLSSELRGIVESPSYYFKDDSLSTLRALDDLMLTHGYRHFEWTQILEEKYPKIAYQPESGITIKGNVTTLWNEKPVPGATVNMLSMKNGLGFNQVNCDSTGYFEFPNLYFNDTLAITLNASADIDKKLKIHIDQSAFTFPEFKFISRYDQYNAYQYVGDKKMDIVTFYSLENVEKINRKWRLSDTIMLNEIKVMTSRYKYGKRPLRLHEKADYSMDLYTKDDELGNVFHKLENKFPNVYIRVFDEAGLVPMYKGPPQVWGYGIVPGVDELELTKWLRVTVDINNDKREPFYVLDGSVVDKDLIADLPAGVFERIEILENGMMYGNPDGGAICFFTKKGAFARMPNSAKMKSSSIIGYSLIRKFYSPSYETPQPSEVKNDFRNTLYWNPIVRTDSEGTARVSYYNSDQAGEVMIVVEGIDANGKLCRGLGTYNVKF